MLVGPLCILWLLYAACLAGGWTDFWTPVAIKLEVGFKLLLKSCRRGSSFYGILNPRYDAS